MIIPPYYNYYKKCNPVYVTGVNVLYFSFVRLFRKLECPFLNYNHNEALFHLKKAYLPYVQ